MSSRAIASEKHIDSRSARFVERAWGLAPFLAGLALLGLLLITANRIGYSRDESLYFGVADRYADWVRLLFENFRSAVKPQTVAECFRFNSEHPPLAKMLFGLSHRFLFERWALFAQPGTSYRFPAFVLAAFSVALLIHWGSRNISRPAGLVAGLSFALLPRVFHHAHVACFDMPITCLCLCSAYLWQRALGSPKLRWSLAFGVIYGLSLATKHNAWLLPAGLLMHGVITQSGTFWKASWVQRRRLAMPAVSLLTISPLVLIAVWPWLWFDTWKHLSDWVHFHRSHATYEIEFLGVSYWKPPMPRAYAPVMTLATIPLTTLALFLIGFFSGARKAVLALFQSARSQTRDSRNARTISDWWLWSLCILSFYSPWLSTNTPIFGGTKHWMTAYPFLCLLVARGFETVRNRIPRALPEQWLHSTRRVWINAALVIGVLTPSAVIVNDMGPWGLSTYTPLVGEAPGAASLGLNRSYWGYTAPALARELSANAPARVYVHDMSPLAWDMHSNERAWSPLLRSSLSVPDSDLALFNYEPHREPVEYQIWVTYGTATPIAIGTYEGVPIVSLYRRPLRP